jgi:hypothetical protein
MQASPFHFIGNFRSRVLSARGLACCFLGLALAASAQPETFYGNPSTNAFIRIAPDTGDWTRHFHIGALVGMNISANFNEQGLFTISGNNAASGIYDDGYVREDQTGNAGGYTGYWGYDNASQYNAAAQTLSMHSSTTYSTSGSSKDDGSAFAGFEMVYGDNLWYWKHARVGWDLGFGLLPISISDSRPMSATVSQDTYLFDTGGIVMPGAPYQGGSSGQGEPVIQGTPSSTSSQTISTGTVTGTRTLDVMLYTLRLGPSFYWDLSEHASLSLGAGPAVGLVSGNYKFDEIITTGNTSARNTGSFGATDVVYGGYVNATLMYSIVDNGVADIFIGAQYMPMTGAAFNGAGRDGRLNLAGQMYFSAGINWPF